MNEKKTKRDPAAIFHSLSEGDLAKVEPLSDTEIFRALERGRTEAQAADAASPPKAVSSKILFR